MTLTTQQMNALASSVTSEWSTPPLFFAQLVAEFGEFTLDPCCTTENAKAPKFYTAEDNGLLQDWGKERVFMNPPYGRTVGQWIAKAYESSKAGALVVCLIPSRTDTAWWHRYVMKGDVRFIRGRLKFGGSSDNAPFPSVVVVFNPPI